MKEFCAHRVKTYAYLMDDGSKKKKAKETKKCVIKRGLMVQNYTGCLLNDKIKSDHYVVYTEEDNKIALISNDDKRLETPNRVTKYPHGKNAFKVCESEMMIVRDLFLENYKDYLMTKWLNHFTITTKVTIIMINFDHYANEKKTA